MNTTQAPTQHSWLRHPYILSGLVLVLAAWLRYPWPGPAWMHIDERSFIVVPLGFWQGNFDPYFFNYPTFQYYLASAVYYLYYLLFSAESLEAFLAFHYFVDSSLILALARALTTLMAVATVAVCIRLGTRLYGVGAGLVAGLILALMPLHARFSHLAATDIPATLWIAMTVLWSVRIVQQGRLQDYILAGVWVGLASATKYPAGLVATAVLSASLLHYCSWRNIGLWLGGGAAILTFALTTPYVWLDWPAFFETIEAMGQEHLLNSGHTTARPTWLHVPLHNLRYGLGAIGLVALIVALVWRPKAWRRDELVLLTAILSFGGFACVASSVFMRYSLPLAPLVAVLLLRLGTSTSWRRWPPLLLILGLAEPAHSTWQLRSTLSGPDTRTQTRQWLHQQYPGTRIIHLPGRIGQVRLLSPELHFKRRHFFTKSYDYALLTRAYQLLSQRRDLPPFYTVDDLAELKPFIAQPDQARSTAVVLYYTHPIIADKQLPSQAFPALDRVRWSHNLSPGKASEAVFDPVDWLFVPVGNWGLVERSGPEIRIGILPLSLSQPVPTARDFFGLHYRLQQAGQLSREGDWKKAGKLYQNVANSPFNLSELLAASDIFGLYLNLGISNYRAGDLATAIKHWHQAEQVHPNNGKIHYNLGAGYLALKRYPKAIEHLLAATRLNNTHSQAFFNLGLAYAQLDRRTLAISAFERALKLHPEVETYLHLAQLHKLVGQLNQSRGYLERALQIAPNHPKTKVIQQLLDQLGPS